MPRPKKTATSAVAEKKTTKKVATKKCATKKTAKKTASKVCASKAKLTRVIAKFDAGWGNQLFIRGLGGSLDWQKGIAMQNISEDEWLWEQLVPCGTVAFKILLNDENWSEGEDFVVSAGDTVICRPSFQ
ncbi:MAG: hypothetical protein E7036_06255 [Opitutales bacterium]|nr:hypothetical protein [Opitutales bacterium]